MNRIDVYLNGDNCWSDLSAQREKIIHVNDNGAISLAGLSQGTEAGKPSVALRINLPDGRVVIVETTLALLLTATDVLRTRYAQEL